MSSVTSCWVEMKRAGILRGRLVSPEATLPGLQVAVSSPARTPAHLSPNLLFSYGHQSFWIRAQPSGKTCINSCMFSTNILRPLEHFEVLGVRASVYEFSVNTIQSSTLVNPLALPKSEFTYYTFAFVSQLV